MTSIGEQIIHRFTATLNERDFDGFGALFVDDYQQHQALATNAGSPAAKHGVRTYYQDRITAFPDMVVTAQPYLVTDEHVAVNFVYTGTHRGAYLDIAPTGRKVTFNSTDIMHIRGHQLAEHWGRTYPPGFACAGADRVKIELGPRSPSWTWARSNGAAPSPRARSRADGVRHYQHSALDSDWTEGGAVFRSQRQRSAAISGR